MNDLDINLEPIGFAEEPQTGSPFNEMMIILAETALNQIKEHAESHLSGEVGGLLVGKLWQNAETVFVEVTAAIPAETSGNIATMRFTAETWVSLEKQKETQFPELKKVGWYHSHLGCGVFLSSLDEFLHQNGFSLPWQVAFVYDPVIGEYGFFRWKDQDLIPIRFYLEPAKDIFRVPRMSQSVSQQLSILSGYLGGLQTNSTITKEAQRLHIKLKSLNNNGEYTSTLVEDVLSTLTTLSEIEPRALKRAKDFVEVFVGQQLVPDQNVTEIPLLALEDSNLLISKKEIYFTKGSILFCASLSQEDAVRAISLPTPVHELSTDTKSLYALDGTGTVYIVPQSEFDRLGKTSIGNVGNTPVSVEIKKIRLLSRPQQLFRAITVSQNFLYLLTEQEIWIIDSTHAESRPRVLNLTNLAAEFPIDAQSLAVDSNGKLYVADAANGRVIQVDKDGSIGYLFIGDGRTLLVTPTSLCISKKELFVLDSTTQRIVVYDLVQMGYSRRYGWGAYARDRGLRKLYSDDDEHVYFSVGHNTTQLYRLDA